MIQITKEELGEIIDLTEQMCNLDGWVKEALPLAQRRMDIITLASARPHTSTQDKRVPYVEVIRDTLYNDADRAMVMIMFLCSFGFAWGYLKCH